MGAQTAYIFLSSSFADMQRERDCISLLCIPELNRVLNPQGIELKTIDLRWGIDTTSIQEEEDRMQEVMKVCLQEIDHCRPLFVGILGHRYGTVLSRESWNKFFKDYKDNNRLPSSPGSVTAAEVYLGGIDSPESIRDSFFLFRDPASYDGMDSKEKEYYYQEKYLKEMQELKDTITKALAKEDCAGQVVKYRADLKNRPADYSDLKEFMSAFENFVLSHVKEAAHPLGPNRVLMKWIEKEWRRFIGNNAFWHNTWINFDEKPGITVLTGESGSGKSTLFAMMHYSMIRGNYKPAYFSYSAGLTAEHSSPSHMLSLWMARARHLYPFTKDDPDFPAVVRHLARLGHKVYLFIDSLDRFGLSQEALQLPFLADCPAHIFVTALPDAAKAFCIYHFKAKVVPMKPLPLSGARQLIQRVMGEAGKNYPELVEILLRITRPDGQPAYGSPLWLRQACHALFTLEADDFEQMYRMEGRRNDEKIKMGLFRFASQIPATPDRLFLQMVRRAEDHFSQDFVDTVLGGIALAWPGVNLTDLEQLLGNSHKDLELALLQRYFAQVIMENTSAHLLSFTHTVFWESMEQHLGAEKVHGLHRRLMELRSKQERADEFLFHALCAYDGQALLDGYHFTDFSLPVLMAFFTRNPEKNIPWFVNAFRYSGTDPLEKMSRQIVAGRWLVFSEKLRYRIAGECGLQAGELFNKCLAPLMQELKSSGEADIRTPEERLDWLHGLVKSDPETALAEAEKMVQELESRPKLKLEAMLVRAKALKGRPGYQKALAETLSYGKSLQNTDHNIIALTWCLMMEHLTAQRGPDAPEQFRRWMNVLMNDLPVHFQNLRLSLRLMDTLIVFYLNVGWEADDLCENYLMLARALREEEPGHPKWLGCILHGNEILLGTSQDRERCHAALEEVYEILVTVHSNPELLGGIIQKGNLLRALDRAARLGLDKRLIGRIQALL